MESMKNDVGMRWEKVILKTVAKISAGQSAPKDSDFSVKDGLPFIRAGHLEQLIAGKNIFSLPTINKEHSLKNRLKVLNKGSILFAKSGMSAMLNRVYLVEHETYYVSHLASVTPDNSVLDSRFCYYFLKHFKTSKLIKDSAYPSIGLPDIEKVEIPLPPLPIQKRIAEILDAADALKRKDQELLKKYDELAQAIFIDMFGDPVKNEKGWEVKKLKSITTKIGSGATPTGGKTAYKAKGISLIRSMNVYDFSFKWKDLAFIDNAQASKLNNVEVMSKDVLFNITGASVCRCSIVPDELLPARVNQHVAIIRAKTEFLNPIFLNHLLVSNSVKTNLLGVGSGGGAVMEAITKEQLEQFEIIVPPINLQNDFEQKINNVFKQKDIDLESIETTDNLFQTLIQKAFKGELVA